GLGGGSSGDVTLDDLNYPPDTIDPIDVPAPGRWKLTVYTVDGAGNKSDSAVEHIWVDPTVPEAPTIAPLALLSAQQLDGGVDVTWSEPPNAASIRSGVCSYSLLIDQNAA